MKRICAWCGHEIGSSEYHKNVQVTHGLCKVCRGRFFALANDSSALLAGENGLNTLPLEQQTKQIPDQSGRDR